MEMNPQSNSESSLFLDTSIPNTARIFDYLLGGTANFAADRQAAEQMLAVMPSLRKWVRLRHAFIQEAAQVLHEEGYTQFLDLGSGIPSADHVHAFVPQAHIIYSDINPMAVSYGNSLFSNLDNVEYIFGDVRDMAGILAAPATQRLIDPQQKVAIGLNALILFLSEEQARSMAQALFDWAPADSMIFVVFQTRKGGAMSSRYEQLLALSAAAGLPIQLYPLETNIGMMQPWQVIRLEPMAEFLGLPDDFVTEADRESIGMEFYAAFLTKDSPE